jgi:alpha-beta hydrolase superfamily lysophospholipase
MTRFVRCLARIARRVLLIALTVIATIWIVRGMAARNKPDLEIWHTYEAEHAFQARDYPDGISLGEYRELEDRLFAEIDEHVYTTVRADSLDTFNRYNKQGLAYAGEEGQAWNRSFSIDTDNPTGGILLLHGASDSPYSVRALAQVFADHGLYVAAFRLPGHGTIPAGLKNAEIKDWIAIARSGAKHVADKIGPELPLYMGGYSTGAALSLDYTLDAVLDDSMRAPDRLFLYSPSIAVTPLARLTRWDLALATIPYFEKMAWLSIGLEYDPYKYNSFPTKGGYLAFTLAAKIAKKLERARKSDGGVRLPPIIAFQSLIDSTVRTDSLVRSLYGRLPANGHELVLFDVNRRENIQHFMVDSERDLLNELEANAPAKYSYTLVTNKSGQTAQIQARTRPEGATDTVDVDLPLTWPRGVYSLSHVAIPFDITDQWYGAIDENGEPLTQSFNAFAPRGEQAVLAVPLGRLMRLRHNPFFAYLEQRTLEFCEVCR